MYHTALMPAAANKAGKRSRGPESSEMRNMGMGQIQGQGRKTVFQQMLQHRLSLKSTVRGNK